MTIPAGARDLAHWRDLGSKLEGQAEANFQEAN